MKPGIDSSEVNEEDWKILHAPLKGKDAMISETKGLDAFGLEREIIPEPRFPRKPYKQEVLGNTQ